MENDYKSEISRLRKKYELNLIELDAQLNSAIHANAILNKENKSLTKRLKAIETVLEEERRSHETTASNLQVSERKRVQFQNELEDIRTQYELSEKARKNVANELSEAGAYVNELTIQVSSLNNEKRRMESDIAAMQDDLNEAINARQAAEDHANRLTFEVNRLADELRQEQENYKLAEDLRKGLEIDIREMNVKFEEAEEFASRKGRRIIAKLQTRVRELQDAFDNEERQGKNALALARKYERQVKEFQTQTEDNNCIVQQLQELLDVTQSKMKAYKQQLDETEEILSITMSKYRKAQQTIEEAEERADLAERSLTILRVGGHGRAISITREVSVLNPMNSRGERGISIR